jgi:hypothetical protein
MSVYDAEDWTYLLLGPRRSNLSPDAQMPPDVEPTPTHTRGHLLGLWQATLELPHASGLWQTTREVTSCGLVLGGEERHEPGEQDGADDATPFLSRDAAHLVRHHPRGDPGADAGA